MLKKGMESVYSLSEKATTDLDSILDYSIINFGVEVMVEYHHSLEKCFALLDENPDLGVTADHVCANYLCFYFRSHAIFYKKNANGILIVRLLHKSMDVQQHFN